MKTCTTCKRQYTGSLKATCPACYMRTRRGTDPDKRFNAPAGEGTFVGIRCSQDERAAWEGAAGKRTLSDWARETLNFAVKPKGKPKV